MLIFTTNKRGRRLSSSFFIRGFTLLELMIVVALIGILSSLAIPQYQNYFKRSKFTEIILQTTKIKSAIDVCYQTRGAGNLALCDTATELGISTVDITNNPNISSINISANSAMITVTANSNLDSKTYILTPTPTNGSLVWNESGSCLDAGIC
ncbi:pilin [Alishewanella sp. HL-SH06]|uniref:pilin n=1 Tax=Alishewanella sp. HL-SH06 TaxID=3461144 RepID=UPI0040427BFF